MCTDFKSKQFPSFSHDIANTLSEMDAAAATMVFYRRFKSRVYIE